MQTITFHSSPLFSILTLFWLCFVHCISSRSLTLVHFGFRKIWNIQNVCNLNVGYKYFANETNYYWAQISLHLQIVIQLTIFNATVLPTRPHWLTENADSAILWTWIMCYSIVVGYRWRSSANMCPYHFTAAYVSCSDRPLTSSWLSVFESANVFFVLCIWSAWNRYLLSGPTSYNRIKLRRTM